MSRIVIETLGGQCPVQADGTIDGMPFYFRARGTRWAIYISTSRSGDPLDEYAWTYSEEYPSDSPYDAGWMPVEEAEAFIRKGADLWWREQIGALTSNEGV